MISSTSPELLSFIAGVNAKKEAYRVRVGLTVYSALTAGVLREGPKYIVIGSYETIASTGEQRPGAIYAFIDRTTGDVLKPATYKAPAKGARGNLFAPDNGLTRCNEFGPGYNR